MSRSPDVRMAPPRQQQVRMARPRRGDTAMSKTDEILDRKARSGQSSIVRRLDPMTGEVIERILPPAQETPVPGPRGTP